MRTPVKLLALAAGVMDASTGLGLVVAPALTLKLMLVDAPGSEGLHLVRFIGCFVWAVGMSYLWGLAGGAARLRFVFGVSLFFRFAAGLFTLVSVFLGLLSPAWAVVSVTDLGLCAAQLFFLRHEESWT